MAQNNHTAQERYLSEARLQLRRAGYETGEVREGMLPVSWQGERLCRVTGGGGVRYNEEDVRSDARNEAFHRLVDITRTTAEYMRLMEAAPVLRAEHLSESYKLLAEFNGVVLAAHKYENVPGHQFVTWARDYSGIGLMHGHYTGDYLSAKEDFATRSGLVRKERQFSDEQLAEIHCCLCETLDSAYPISSDRAKQIQEAAKQIENALPDLEQRTESLRQREADYAMQYCQEQQMI